MKVPSTLPDARPVKVKDPTLQIDGSALVTAQRAVTLSHIPPVPYAFTSDGDRVRLAWLATMSLGALEEGRVVLRSRWLPTDVAGMVDALDGRVRSRGTPAESWEAYRDGQGRRVEVVAPLTKASFIEVDLGRRSGAAVWAGRPRRVDPLAPLSGGETRRWAGKADAVRGRLAAGGLGAHPLDAAGVRALRRASITRSPALPSATGRRVWGLGEIACDFDDIEVVPGLRWARVESPSGTRFVATLVTSAFPMSMTFPDVEPWLAHLDRLDFPVESDLVFDLVPAKKARADIERRRNEAVEQRAQAERARVDLPTEVGEMLALGAALEYTIPTRRLPLAYGWARVRVDAGSPAELQARVIAVRDAMGTIGGSGIDVAWPGGRAQVDLLLEGAPGLPVRNTSWKQRWMLETVACALPWAGAPLHQHGGSYRGWRTGRTPGAVVLDLHAQITTRPRPTVAAAGLSLSKGAELERPGGIVCLGEQGAGKSGALSQMIFDGTEEGTHVFALDPSRRLRRVAQTPECVGTSDEFDLLGDGISVDPMGPHLIPDPVRREPVEDTASGVRDAELAWQAARAKVQVERQHLTRDTLHTMAWRQLQDKAASTALLVALRRVSTSSEPSMAALVADLKKSTNAAAKHLGEHLAFELTSAEGTALLAERTRAVTGATTRIISMQGIALPEAGKPIDQWMPAEGVAAATFGCAAHLARRLLWGMPPDTLKLFIVDEAHVPLSSTHGRAVITETLRDGRKHGCITVLATHNAVDLGDQRVRAACPTKFLFRSDDPDEHASTFAFAGIQNTEDHRAARAGLANGECIAVLYTGERDRMKFDLWPDSLSKAAKTTPTGIRVAA